MFLLNISFNILRIYIFRFFVCKKDEPNVDEINAWLLQVEEKLNQLDAVSIDQLTEHHFEQCKVYFYIY